MQIHTWKGTCTDREMSASGMSSFWVLQLFRHGAFSSKRLNKMQMLRTEWRLWERWHKLCGISIIFLLLGRREPSSALLFTANSHQVVVCAAIASLVSRKKPSTALSFVFSLSSHYLPKLQQPFLFFPWALVYCSLTYRSTYVFIVTWNAACIQQRMCKCETPLISFMSSEGEGGPSPGRGVTGHERRHLLWIQVSARRSHCTLPLHPHRSVIISAFLSSLKRQASMSAARAEPYTSAAQEWSPE